MELGVRRDREHHADVDIRARQLGAKAFSQTDLRELRRGVCAHLRDAPFADDGRDEYEMSGILLAENRQRRAGGVEGAEIVDIEKPPHVLVRDLVERSFDAESGVADHHVQTIEALDGLADQPPHLLFVRHVGDDGQRAAAERLDLAHQRVQAIAPAARSDHRRPVPRKAKRRRAANSRRRAGNDDHSG